MGSGYWITSSALAFVSLLPGAVLGPAFGAIARHQQARTVDQILSEARRIVGPARRSGRPASDSADSDDFPWLLGVGMLVAILLYVQHRPWVLLTMSAAAVLIFLVSAVVVWIAWRRKVVAGSRARLLCFLIPGFLTICGVVDAVLLWNAVGVSAEMKAALGACTLDGSSAGPEDVAALAYTVLGIFVFGLVTFLSIWYSLAQVAAIYVVERARPAWLWTTFFRQSMFTSKGWALAVFPLLALLSVAACSGLLFDLVNTLPTSGEPTSNVTAQRVHA